MKTLIKYLLYGMTPQLPIISSAIVQQSIVLIAFYLWKTAPDFQLIGAVLTFSVLFHLPNYKLMGLTFLFGLLFYPMVFYYSIYTLPLVAVLHASFGTVLYNLKFDMTTWRFNK